MDLKKIRENSLSSIKDLGLDISKSLPILDQVNNPRNKQQIINRTLVLYVIVAHSYGFHSSKALKWLEAECLMDELTLKEMDYLTRGIGDSNTFQLQVESLWALIWIISITSSLDYSTLCPNNFIKYFPDLKTQEKSFKFKKLAQLREIETIIKQADIAYCLQWSLENAAIHYKNKTNIIPRYMVQNRRKALDWVLWNEPWDEISLDT
ncbi:DUF4272 domain-containing protein [Candidatus Dojkabacteria bacterium]|nr:DUF4272 domain-containing protein [Candidatus Dojkabacteria bacterium]